MALTTSIIPGLQQECGYDPDGDGSVDALIAYKDALEDIVGFVETQLRANALGGSAADAVGAMWERGLDPAPEGWDTEVAAEQEQALNDFRAALDVLQLGEDMDGLSGCIEPATAGLLAGAIDALRAT